MKISKLLNKNNSLIIIIFLFYNFVAIAEEQPIDIWSINKESIENESKKKSLIEISEVKTENSVYKMQSNKQNDSILLDSELASKDTKIVG